MKPGDLVQVRVPNGWVDYDSIDGQVGLLLEIERKTEGAIVMADGNVGWVSLAVIEVINEAG